MKIGDLVKIKGENAVWVIVDFNEYNRQWEIRPHKIFPGRSIYCREEDLVLYTKEEPMKIGDRVKYVRNGVVTDEVGVIIGPSPGKFKVDWVRGVTTFTSPGSLIIVKPPELKPVETKNLDLRKPVQTRSGLPVRILCTDRKGKHPIHGLIDSGDHDGSCSWTLEGKWLREEWDLVQVPPPPPVVHKKWIVIFRSGTSIHTTTTLYDDINKAKADWKTRMKRVIAFAPVEYTEE